MIEVELSAVRVDVHSNSPVLLLQEIKSPKRTLPIFIGAPEANAIEMALRGVEVARPLTHDLLKSVIDMLGASVLRVVITELKDRTFFAELELVRGKTTTVVSTRPSDAVALAIRARASIFVSDELMDAEGIVVAEEELEVTEETQEEIVDEFRDFLDNINPEDFS